jgi:hypothetical protein
MPISQVNDRIKEAPVVVLRAVFAGIGQILLTADKVRARATEQVGAPGRAAGHASVAPVTATATAATAGGSGTAATPDVRSTRTTPAAPAAKAARAAKAMPAPSAAKAVPAARAAKAVPAARAAKAAPAPAAPPLPGWDELSIASLRARLRGLDAAAIRDMLAYEKAHARREPVITMLERRLAKITAG